jgi:hypothetical protein
MVRNQSNDHVVTYELSQAESNKRAGCDLNDLGKEK